MYLLNKEGVFIGGRAVSGTKILETSFASHDLVKKSLAGNEIVTGITTTLTGKPSKVVAIYVLEQGF